MDNNGDIKANIISFHNHAYKHSESRYKSWEYCYSFIQENKGNILSASVLDTMSLHLAFYLASWGMLRGSSFLLGKSYRVHIEPLRIMLSDKYSQLHNIKACDLRNNINLVSGCIEDIKGVYKDQPNCKIPTDTLVTKILLGVYGCVPAYDRFFKNGASQGGYTANLGRKSLLEMCDLFIDNSKEFNAAREEIGNSLYTDMKLVDMYLWQKGFGPIS